MPANAPTLARDELARIAEKLHVLGDNLAVCDCHDGRCIVQRAKELGASDAHRLADALAALLAAVERGAEDTARLGGLERFACVIETRTSEGYQERFERDADEEFADWLDFVIANTDANQQDELAARATPTGADHA